MTATTGWIDETVQIPDLLRAVPQARSVLDRYGLRGRRVVMTLGRLALSERLKGFDEMLDIMPRMVAEAHYGSA